MGYGKIQPWLRCTSLAVIVLASTQADKQADIYGAASGGVPTEAQIVTVHMLDRPWTVTALRYCSKSGSSPKLEDGDMD